MSQDSSALAGCPPHCACLCHTEVDEPGPHHLPTCAWSDPDFDDGGPLPGRDGLARVIVAVSDAFPRRRR
jgi:hypothetical protein